jgi:hypothetical protein
VHPAKREADPTEHDGSSNFGIEALGGQIGAQLLLSASSGRERADARPCEGDRGWIQGEPVDAKSWRRERDVGDAL